MSRVEKVCNEDGELRLLVNPLTHTVRSKEQDEGYKKQVEKKRDNRHFNWADMENIQKVISNLSNVHLGYLLHLQCFIELGTNVLKGKGGKEMTKKTDIQKALGISKDVNTRFCKAVEDIGVLEKVDGRLQINPSYHFNGTINDQKVIKLFTTTLTRLCETLKPVELGFLYKLLPFVHLETNMICINPFEDEPSKIQFLNIQGIAEVTGIHEKNVSSLIRELRKQTIVVESIREDKRNTFITLNPYIFYRKGGLPDKTLKGMFASSPYAIKKR
jgi:hypothetical protein